MKKNLIPYLLFLFTSVCFCQNSINTNDFLKGYIEYPENFIKEVSLVPNNRYSPIIEVEINHKKYHFLFDTGAMMTIISDKIVDSNKLKEENKINISGGGANDKDEIQIETYVITENIKINDVGFNDISMAVTDLEELNKYLCDTKIDGILGMNLIKLCNWKINSFGAVLSFSDRTFESVTQPNKIALKYHAGLLPLINITQGKNEFWALLDTGFDNTLQLYTDFKFNKKMRIRTGEGNFMVGINGVKNGRMEEIILDKIFLDTYELQNITANILNGKPLIGMGILKNHTVLLNFSENNMMLIPSKVSTATETKNDFGAGFCINEKEELQVCFIWDNSQLKKNGIKIGDKVTAINNEPVDKISNQQYCDFNTLQKTASTITLTFSTPHGEKTIMLQK